ncbi:MAG: nucleoside-diphosphate kinase [Thermotaleaceae bacterium]
MEKTLVIVKPDGVERKLIGEIVSRYEKKGFYLLGAKMICASRETLEKHYEEHSGKPFFGELIEYMIQGPLMAMVIEGENAIDVIRLMNGHKDPRQALPGTIRGDYAHSITKNIIHASDSLDSAMREIKIWFPELSL